MDFAQFQEFYTANAESEDVKQFVSQFATPITQDSVKALLEGEEDHEVKALFAGMTEAEVEKFKQKFMETDLPTLVDTKVQELYPEETPERKKEREYEARIKSLEDREKMAEVKLDVTNYATEHDLPLTLVVKFVSTDKDATMANVKEFQVAWDKAMETKVEEVKAELQNGHVRNPKQGKGDGVKITKEMIDNASPAWINRNWQAILDSGIPLT